MDNLEIFDKDGKRLHIADIIYSFIKDSAEKNKKYIEDVFVGVDLHFSKGYPDKIYMCEAIENGYDGIYLSEFGDSINITIVTL